MKRKIPYPTFDLDGHQNLKGLSSGTMEIQQNVI